MLHESYYEISWDFHPIQGLANLVESVACAKIGFIMGMQVAEFDTSTVG